MEYKIEYDNEFYEYKINGINLNDNVVENHEYQIIETEEFIDELICWIAECKEPNDKQLMKNDLKYLMSLDDQYIFSSNDTNNYVAESDDTVTFNRIAQELIDLQIEKNLNL